MNELNEKILSEKWFYHFDLPGGQITEIYIPEDVHTLHEVRREMIDGYLTNRYGDSWSERACLDLACHEGYFASDLARKGFGSVLGIDVRQENIERARMIKEVYGLTNLELAEHDVFDSAVTHYGTYDVVLMLGLLYHVENPVGLLRIARAHTRDVCIIETQVAPNVSGVTDWGSYRFTKPIVGSFAIVDEASEVARDNREANSVAVSLFPSVEGLLFLMGAVGFSATQILEPPAERNEQLSAGKRVVVVGYA